MHESDTLPVIAVIGGTGALGNALAARWARAGYTVVIGSRSEAKAVAAAERLREAGAAASVRGAVNRAAAELADVIVVTVPFASHAEILADIRPAVAGKIVVDTTVPLVPPKVGTVQLPSGGSAALEAQGVLGDNVTVASAFHNVAAHKLGGGDRVDCDVLVCGDSRRARETGIALAEAAGLRGLHAGPLANSVAPEALTSVLIQINRRYKVDGAGIRITGDVIDPHAGS
ncbi:MAG: NADPH-dependent F420 reductase [Gammaproteobacteria bacterium]|nr:NADPH-dependent F420 reductase [Gammaproteobacteria bacterium]NIR84374.1 NADPH-dependent F420 reductase [Gammaproteobacteria bacterium]NIR90855.1 NADPH-dependent F420 reductase [Gammaproteobacteria bacterium]NIU07041.1 NADPH-dependent F420 reductase [Gammaproteobacteria bacterium]NIV76170.1 NADPH-dependent F420 reductase [Gammaproteobacteria bacterium]